MNTNIRTICIIELPDPYPVNRNLVIFKGFREIGVHLNIIQSKTFETRTALRDHTYHSKFWLKLVPKILMENFFLFYNMAWHIRDIRKSDILYVASYGNYIIPTVKFFSILCNKKIIFDAHGSLYFQRILGTADYPTSSAYARIIFLIDKITAKLSYKYITLSRAYAKRLSDEFNMNVNRFISAYNGTVQTKIESDSNTDNKHIDAIHLSSFKEFHGVLELIDVVHYLVNVRGYRTFTLCLAGRGKLLKKCIEKTKRLGLDDNVQFPRYLYKESLAKAMSKSKMAIGPVGNSELNTIDFSTKICDYLFFGKITILPDTPSTRELIQDGISGFLCDYREIHKIAAAIERILNLDDEKAREIERNALAVYDNHLKPIKIAQHILDQIFL